MRRILMLGLDAAEITLIQNWTADGSMPMLKKLMENGGMLPLQTPATQFIGSPWPSFYMSQSPAEHGMYHFLVWRPDQMKTSRPSRSWLKLKPFWRQLARNGKSVIAIDLPQAYAPRSHPGKELSGWATHEVLEPPASQPPEFLDWVNSEFGKPPLDHEASHPLTFAEAMAVRDQCIHAASLVGTMVSKLITTESWDLALMCLTSTHRAGHQLWDRTSLTGNPTESELVEFDDALRQVYIAVDTAVGRIVECAGEQTAIMVFALHGMGTNTSRTVLTGEMLNRILGGAETASDTALSSAADALRQLVPIKLRSAVKNRLPIVMQDWLTLFWRLRGINWSQTRAFAQFGDLDAYVRINLRGREAAGIVDRGSEYDALCQQIANGFMSFVDEDSGEPVVSNIEYIDDVYPTGALRETLPDLIIHWSPSSAAYHRRIISPLFGTIDWPTPGIHTQGRSGDHARTGFLLYSGIELNSTGENASILDLAPTVYDLLNVSMPDDFQGSSLAIARE